MLPLIIFLPVNIALGTFELSSLERFCRMIFAIGTAIGPRCGLPSEDWTWLRSQTHLGSSPTI